jgi:monofunctional biosynthetic peptidoglycan transglycosylase
MYFLSFGEDFLILITIIQIEGLVKYQKLDRDYISLMKWGKYKTAVIASEDQNFYKHNGFDFTAIQQSLRRQSKKEKNKRRKYYFSANCQKFILWNGGGYFRKGLEAVFTFTIEKVWNKNIILERYLNSIEMGQGVFGIEAASKLFLKKF